jgi:hypothetical protein
MSGTAISLYVLATLDAMFSGVCAASGRDARINKRSYYLKAMIHGIGWGQVACVVGLLILAAALKISDDPRLAMEQMVAVGDRMVQVFAVYAAIILAFFAVRAIPSVDIRSMTSTVAFGPLTLIRPAVVVCGIGWGLAIGPQPPIIVAGILICVLMAPFRVWLNRWFDMKRWVAGGEEPGVLR